MPKKPFSSIGNHTIQRFRRWGSEVVRWQNVQKIWWNLLRSFIACSHL